MCNPTLEEQLAAALQKIEWYKGKIALLTPPGKACPPTANQYCDEVGTCKECWDKFWEE